MLSDVLKREMQSRDLSVRQAAKEIGVSHSTIFRVLRGDPFDVPTLIAVATWLNVRPSTLLDNIAKSDTVNEIAMLIESNPGILDVLKDALEAVRKQQANPEIIQDIISYAVYKLSLQGKRDAVNIKDRS
jgi:transcriptional regulator with XRE-family HTH domain